MIRTSGAIKVERVNGSLISVKPVGGKEHGHKCQHAPILKDPDIVGKLLSRRASDFDLDKAAIGTNDPVRWKEEGRAGDTNKDDNQDRNVR